MADINGLVEEFWKTSSASDGPVEASFLAMRCLFEILQGCFLNLEVCFISFFFFATDVDLADKKLQLSVKPTSWQRQYSAQSDERIRAKFKILLDGYRKMFDHSLSKYKDLDDMLKFLPGVVVQNHMSMQGMTHLYRNKQDLLERLIKSTILVDGDIWRPSFPGHFSRYKLDHYLSGFLQDQDRSRLYYCDPMIQHISICRRFLSLLDGSDALDFQL